MSDLDQMRSLVEWCEIEREKIGAIDGYDYRSGEEYGLRRAQIEIERRIKIAGRVSSQQSALGEK
jgi:hypothetical protein